MKRIVETSLMLAMVIAANFLDNQVYAQPNYTACDGQMDLLLILDVSSNLSPANLQNVLNYVVSFVNLLTIGPTNVQVAEVKYSNEGGYADTIINFRDYPDDKTQLEANIWKTVYAGLAANLTNALFTAYNGIFQSTFGARLVNVQRVALILTAGPATNNPNLVTYANTAAANGIQIIPVGITSNVNATQLDSIAYNGNYIAVSNFSELGANTSNEILNDINNGTCYGIPTSTTSTSTTTTPLPTTTTTPLPTTTTTPSPSTTTSTTSFSTTTTTTLLPTTTTDTTPFSTTTTTTVTPLNNSCGGQVDLLLIIDTSSNLNETAFHDVLNYAVSFVDLLTIGPTNVQVAEVKYSNEGGYTNTIINFRDYPNKTGLNDHILRTTYEGETANVADAIFTAYNNIFQPMFGARLTNVQRVAVILAAGPATNDPNLMMYVGTAVADGIQIIPVGITNKVNATQLDSIAYNDNYIAVSNVSQLGANTSNQIMASINNGTCYGIPSSTSSTSITISTALPTGTTTTTPLSLGSTTISPLPTSTTTTPLPTGTTTTTPLPKKKKVPTATLR